MPIVSFWSCHSWVRRSQPPWVRLSPPLLLAASAIAFMILAALLKLSASLLPVGSWLAWYGPWPATPTASSGVGTIPCPIASETLPAVLDWIDTAVSASYPVSPAFRPAGISCW